MAGGFGRTELARLLRQPLGHCGQAREAHKVILPPERLPGLLDDLGPCRREPPLFLFVAGVAALRREKLKRSLAQQERTRELEPLA